MNNIIKKTAVVLVSLIGLTLITGIALYSIGKKKLMLRYPDIKIEYVKIPSDTDVIVRGKHIATIWACTRCHGDNLGGTIMTKDPIEGFIPLLGTIPASNLTSGKGGIANSYRDADWVRAIRHGVKPNGHSEVFMYNYSTMSDRDLGDLIAYLKQIPPVDSDLPELNYGQIFPVFPAIGMFTPVAEKIDHVMLHPSETEPGTTTEYGKYISALCTSCHGSNFISPLQGKYKQEEFARALRTGILPNGTQISRPMPPKIYGQMSDTEIGALWLYLQDQSLSQR